MHAIPSRSYKGSHLALLVELLAGPLVGGAIADKVGIGSLFSHTRGSSCTVGAFCSTSAPVQDEQSPMPALIAPYTGGKRQLGQPRHCNRPQPAWRHGSFQVLCITSANVIQQDTIWRNANRHSQFSKVSKICDATCLCAFRRGVEAVLARTKAARLLPGSGGVTLPGERGSRLAGADLYRASTRQRSHALHALYSCRRLLGSLNVRVPMCTNVYNSHMQTVVLHMPAATRQAANSISVPRQLLQDLEALAAQAPPAAAAAPAASTASTTAQAGSSVFLHLGLHPRHRHDPTYACVEARDAADVDSNVAGRQCSWPQHWVPACLQNSSTAAAKVEAPPGRGIGTRILHPGSRPVHDPYGAVSPPLYQTATFGQPGATEGGPYDYTRSGNPTRTQLESQMAELEVRSCCRAQSSKQNPVQHCSAGSVVS